MAVATTDIGMAIGRTSGPNEAKETMVIATAAVDVKDVKPQAMYNLRFNLCALLGFLIIREAKGAEDWKVSAKEILDCVEGPDFFGAVTNFGE